MPSPEPGVIGSPDSPLVVISPGGVLVATDALLAHLPELASLADAVETDSHHLALLALEPPPDRARAPLERCERLAAELAAALRRMRAALVAAAAGYTAAERLATSAHDAASGWAAALLPRLALPFLPGAAAGVWLGWQLAPGGDEAKRAALQRWLLEHPELITSPEFATLVRHLVSGVDDAALALAGLPPGLAWVLGEQGLGLLGVDTSAAALIGIGTWSGTRLFHETPVRVERVSTQSGDGPPAGAADRLARVPGERQVRIERYSAPGAPDRFVVYIAPTQTFSPVADHEPWDLTSNVAGVAGLPAGSIRATEQAMADAGITAESEVMLVGFSQGGLVADAVAGSGRWNTVGLETYGDPGGGIELPDGIRGVAVRHSDDFVVATGGAQQPTDRTIVERRAYPEGAPLPTDRLAPAHQRDAYLRTAELLDAAQSPGVRAELEALDAFTRDYAAREGSTTTTFGYRAQRIPDGVSASSSAGGR